MTQLARCLQGGKEHGRGTAAEGRWFVPPCERSACRQKAGISSRCTRVNCEEHQIWVEYRGSYGETNPEPSLGPWAARGWSAAVFRTDGNNVNSGARPATSCPGLGRHRSGQFAAKPPIPPRCLSGRKAVKVPRGLGERSETIIMWGLSEWGICPRGRNPGGLPLRNSPLPMVTWLARVRWR